MLSPHESCSLLLPDLWIRRGLARSGTRMVGVNKIRSAYTDTMPFDKMTL